jgi:hypothetical protein
MPLAAEESVRAILHQSHLEDDLFKATQACRSSQLSEEARDWAVVRRLAWKIDLDVIDIAPAPALWRVVALDDGMTGRFKVPSRVTMGRLITATDVSAIAAKPQVYPRRSDPQAFLAAERARGDDLDLKRV